MKNLNSYFEYNHFKMKGLFLLNKLHEEGDYFCKLNLKNPYFSVPFLQVFQSYEKFQWKQKLYHFLRIGFSTRSIYETHESFNCYTKKIKYTAESLLRRYSPSCKVSKGIDYGKAYIDFSVIKSGWWWWWIVFVVWLIDERRLALFPVGTIVRDLHHLESPTCSQQDLNLCRTQFRLVEWSYAVVITTTPQRHLRHLLIVIPYLKES